MNYEKISESSSQEVTDETIYYENDDITNKINAILKKRGFKNYEVNVYPQEIYNEINDYIKNNYIWAGSEQKLESSSRNNDDEIIYKDMTYLYNWINQKTIAEIYEKRLTEEMIYNNYTIIILFNKISKIEKDELLEILYSNISDIEQEDDIFVYSLYENSNFE
jgi:hypothetical protein